MTQQYDLSLSAERIFRGALEDCAVDEAFSSHRFEVDLSGTRRLLVIAAGKAGASLLKGLLRTISLPRDCEILGVLISPHRPDWLPAGIEFFAGGHPLPTAESVAGARAVLAVIERARSTQALLSTFCFFLFSGGASSMMELPLEEDITLPDLIDFYRSLVHSGASIMEINSVRKHVSAVKGGRLGLAAATIPNLTLLVSDVPDSQLDALASGPTMPDTSTIEDCREVVERFGLSTELPESVQFLLQSATLPETPKPGQFPSRVLTLLSSNDLCLAAERHAIHMGFKTIIDNSCDEWDYKAAADYLLARLRTLRQGSSPICLLSAGEVSVRVLPEPTLSETITAQAPMGGRNQHFALYAATRLTPQDGNVAILSAGSDGIDGNSPFAGAVLTHEILRGSRESRAPSHIDPTKTALAALDRFDSTSLLRRLHATIETGPTGNNLRDLRILLAG